MKSGRVTITTRFIFYVLLLTTGAISLVSCGSTTPQLKPLSSSDVIVAFGDSLTYGTGASTEASYPAILEKIIGIKVMNEGVPGEETADGLKRIGSVIDKYHPRLVIVFLGGNDQLRKRPFEEIKANLKKIIQLIRNNGIDVLLIAAPRPSLNLSVPGLYAELGEEMNIPVDDTTLANLLSQQEMKSDYIHLNAAGYKALAESIAETIKKTGALGS